MKKMIKGFKGFYKFLFDSRKSYFEVIGIIVGATVFLLVSKLFANILIGLIACMVILGGK